MDVKSSPGPRERLLRAAEELFYAEGINAVGVDRLCREAAVSKRSLYQHFDGKDGVVVQMLRRRGAEWRDRLAGDTASLPARERLLAVFDHLDAQAGRDDFHGCAFVGAATELKDRRHPGHVIAARHKRALSAYLAETAREAGASEPDQLADQLALVFDGASAHGVVHGGTTPATRSTVELLLGAHGLGPPVGGATVSSPHHDEETP